MGIFKCVLCAAAIAAVTLAACKSIDQKPSASQLAITANSPQVQATKYPDGANRISVSDLKAALAAGTAVVIDVRGQSQYDAGHIKGAILIPAGEIGNRVNEIPRGKTIITYCS
jgi:3-mercaptopyruvate sulfurtransferase SseA